MIKVKTQYQNNLIYKIEVKGHANYAVHGSDIVCAAVSTLVTMTINFIEKFKNIENIDFIVEEGFSKIQIVNNNDFVQKTLELLIESFQDLQKNYKSYIKIVEV